MIGLLLKKEEYKTLFNSFSDINHLDLTVFKPDQLDDYKCVFAHESDIKVHQVDIERYFREKQDKYFVLFSGGFSRSGFITYRSKKLHNCLRINYEILNRSLADFMGYHRDKDRVELRILLGGYISFLRHLRDSFLNHYLEGYNQNFARDIIAFEDFQLIFSEFDDLKNELHDFVSLPSQEKFIIIRDKMNEIIMKELLTNA